MIYELSEQARADIKEIIRYTIENFGTDQADEYTDGLFYSFDLLTDNPRLGKSVLRELGGNVRRYTYRSHYVVYEIRSDVIRIAAIFNTRQELPEEWR
ncbi:type II toxin-antitoxin system RelE/ParE family toxin [uncultured Roseibium sp.]|uniref:type II toxin-antitoxin system RelE/ParE family toxin n=1 Tax=uncultured Roseibium sp. TaxID=1936171 RepID=UPI002601BB47|nr:type II toxin-antitoxin system RelE/ParE family toxin [uncultured Roseibium sp.]